MEMLSLSNMRRHQVAWITEIRPKKFNHNHWMKSPIMDFFPVFSRIQSIYDKWRTRKHSAFGHFSHSGPVFFRLSHDKVSGLNTSNFIKMRLQQRYFPVNIGCCSGVFIVNFEHISHLFLVFLLLTLSK